MDFKVDENLPSEACQILRDAGHNAVSVLDQHMGGRPDADIATVCASEMRCLVTLDTDFANMIAYPPGDYSGIVVFRSGNQAKPTVLGLIQQFLSVLASETLDRHLWIVEHDRIRVRGPE